jgi:arginase
MKSAMSALRPSTVAATRVSWHFGGRAPYSTAQRTVSLISLPVNLGQPLLGPDRTPRLLRENGLLDVIKDCGWRVNSIPEVPFKETLLKHKDRELDLPSHLKANNLAQVGSVCKLIYEQGLEYAATDDFLLIIGGDHCIPIGSLAAIKTQRKNTGIVWVDAHADLHTPATSTSGNMHGMPLGFLLGLYPDVKNLPEMEWFPTEPILSPADIVYIGLR